MRAIGTKTPRPIDDPQSLVDIELPRPVPAGRDLLVEVRAISVNPVDTKVRAKFVPTGEDWKVLGFDAAGTVVEVGPDARNFKPGDPVYCAGSWKRQGNNAEFHLVDEALVGPKPASLDWSEAAALPLTAITAWESLFDRLDVNGRPVAGAANAILIIGGAGGVSSIAIQLARALTSLTVIATASRPETRDWVTDLGAHHVVDHGQPLAAQVAALGTGAPAFVLSTTNTGQHLAQIAELIAPQGRFALIDDMPVLDIAAFKAKCLTVSWEMMFSRSDLQTADMAEQGRLLAEVARLVDAGTIRTTLGERFGPINAENLRRAHALVESGKARGKVTLEGF